MQAMWHMSDQVVNMSWNGSADCEKQQRAIKTAYMEPYWCEDFGVVFSEMGVPFDHLSLIDFFATDELIEDLKDINGPSAVGDAIQLPRGARKYRNERKARKYRRNDRSVTALLAQLENYDIIAFDGGNPDLHRLGLSLACEQFVARLIENVNGKKQLYVGRSAGAIIASRLEFTAEPNPNLWYVFSEHGETRHFWPKGNMNALSFIDCAIRPHYKGTWENAVQLYVGGNEGSCVARIQNDAGLFCHEGCVAYCTGESGYCGSLTDYTSNWRGEAASLYGRLYALAIAKLKAEQIEDPPYVLVARLVIQYVRSFAPEKDLLGNVEDLESIAKQGSLVELGNLLGTTETIVDVNHCAERNCVSSAMRAWKLRGWQHGVH